MKFLFALCFAFAMPVYAASPAQAGDYNVRLITLLSAVTTTGAGTAQRPPSLAKTFQAAGLTTAGSGAATVLIQVSDIDSPGTDDWITLGTITLTLGTTNLGEGFATSVKWKWVRANVTSISGTNSAVTVTMGY